jgi:hypothetical protein
MPEAKFTAKYSQSLVTQYRAVVSAKLNNCFAVTPNLKFSAREEDLKDVKSFPAVLVLKLDEAKLGLTMEVRPPQQKVVPLQSWNLGAEKDTKKLRKVLECLGGFNGLLSGGFLDQFDKKHPDQAALDDLKNKIKGKDDEIKKLEDQLKDLKKEKADLEKEYKDKGGK